MVQQYWDEALLLVPRMQPGEINELEIKDYWRWCEVCEREINRRGEHAERLSHQVGH
ncbi:hypothetical protein [Stutzerimonas nitrititolerans]|uniref:hypothetical protein n=1 Tax=Stutzerimonas nitrititolerans TaxID=2482751 RepID=UPI0026474D7A|nr:hypothetical protein [Stutzerimonas nitrititolerans]